MTATLFPTLVSAAPVASTPSSTVISPLSAQIASDDITVETLSSNVSNATRNVVIAVVAIVLFNYFKGKK